MENNIVIMCETFKEAFPVELPSGGKFFKFHTVTHCPLQLKYFANLELLNSNRSIIVKCRLSCQL